MEQIIGALLIFFGGMSVHAGVISSKMKENKLPLRSYLQFILKLILLTLNSGCVLVPSYRDYTDQDSIKCESLYCRSEMESRFKDEFKKVARARAKKKAILIPMRFVRALHLILINQ